MPETQVSMETSRWVSSYHYALRLCQLRTLLLI
jgi:hypothetical protein